MTVLTPPQPQIRRFQADVGPAAIYEAMREDGLVIIEGFLGPEEVHKLNQEVEPELAKITDAREDKRSMAALLPAQSRRVYGLAEVSRTFRHDVLNHELMHELCKAIFEEVGDYWLAAGVMIDNGPGTPQQALHRDHRLPPLLEGGPDSPETLVNFFTALTDSTAESGATQIVWGSHKKKGITEPGPENPLVVAELKAGDSLLMSAKMVHRGGFNGTETYHRRALSLSMSSTLFTPFEANLRYSRALIESMTPLAQKMVGWRTVHPLGVGMWAIDMHELGEKIGLKSNQPLKESENLSF